MTEQQKLATLAVDLPGAKHVEVRVTPGKLWINVDGVCLLRIAHVENTVIDVPHTQLMFNRVEPVPGFNQDPTGLLPGEGDDKWRMENLMPGWKEAEKAEQPATPPPPADNLPGPGKSWECPQCGAKTDMRKKRCVDCGERRTFPKKPKWDEEDGE